MSKTPTAINLELLIKLLKLTSSSNDGEAIVAMRKANQQVEKVGGDWETLLRGKVTIIADPFAGGPASPIPDPIVGNGNGWRPPPRPAAPPQYQTQRTYNPPPNPPPRPTYNPPPNPNPPPQPPKVQTAIVNFSKRSSQWILSSNESLSRHDLVSVTRRDGKTDKVRVGTLIEQKNQFWYYNIEGKTNLASVNDLSF
jgi:hypothetical protein